MLKLVVLFILAVGGAAILAWVMFYGATRRHRMAQFVRDLEGTWALYDDFDLQRDVDELLGRGEWWVGGSGRLDETGSASTTSSLYLLDLHADPQASPQRTAALVTSRRFHSEGPLVLRERLVASPSEEDADADPFEVAEGELSENLRGRLDDLPEDRDWLLELRRTGSQAAVSSRDRPLSSRREWEQLLDAAELLTGE